MNRILSIDGLRFYAILPVIIFHIDSTLLKGGFLGVDVFFIISGFIITYTYLKNNIDFNILVFWKKRFSRLLPSLISLYTICLLFSYFIFLPNDFKNFGQQLFSSSIYLSNFYFYVSHNYFSDWVIKPLLLHTWSLSIEEQFYFVFPFLFLFFNKIKNLTYILTIIILLIFLSSFLMFTSDNMVSFYLLHTRFFEFLIGVIAAYYVLNFKVNFNNYIIFASFILLIFCFIFFDSDYHLTYYLLIPISLIFIIILGVHKDSFRSWYLTSKPIVYIGTISYSLYLFHFPIIIFNDYYFNINNELIIFLLIFLFAIVNYTIVEKPFRTILNLLSLFKNYFLVFSLSLSFACIGLLIHFKVFTSISFNDSNLIHLLSKPSFPSDFDFSLCANSTGNAQCDIISGFGERKFIIIGDSFSADLIGPLKNIFDGKANLSAFSTYSCKFNYLDLADEYCSKSYNRFTDLIYSDFTDIIFTINYSGLNSSDLQKQLSDLSMILISFTKADKRVYLLPYRDVYQSSPVLAYNSISIPEPSLVVMNPLINKFFSDISKIENVLIFDYTPLNNPELYYFDHGHMSYDGASLYLNKIGITYDSFK